MGEKSPGVFSSLYSIVKAFLKDFYTESKRGTVEHAKGLSIFLSFLFLCFLVTLLGAYKISESPVFCGLCHNMKVYVDSWKTSSHKNVPCIDCHYKPGFANHLKGKWKDGQVSLVYFVTGKKITKPHAEIDDTSCLQSGCHRKEDLNKKIAFKNVIFNHLQHMGQIKREKQLRCTTCHSQIVQGAHITVTEVNCFICHFYKTKGQKEFITGCTSCHFEAKGDIKVDGFAFNHKKYIKRGVKCESCHANVITGDGHIQENTCLQCHNKREILEAKYTPAVLHKNHVTDHKVECFLCHSAIKHQVRTSHVKETGEGECSRCHEPEAHAESASMYLGKGAKFLKDMPSRKAMLNMDCSVCHGYGKDAAAARNRCKECHGNFTEGMVARWNSIMKVKEDDLKKEINETRSLVLKKDEGERWKTKLDGASYNLMFLSKGKASHNILYSMALIEKTKNILGEIKGKAAERSAKEVRPSISCTGICHGNIGEQKIPFGKVFFLHEIHAEDEDSCLKCHTPYSDHGKTTDKGCSGCHHGQGMGKVTCKDCHRAEEAMLMYRNSFHSKLLCTDCHSSVTEGKKAEFTGIKNSCLKCHPKRYLAKVDEWVEKNRTIAATFEANRAGIEKEITVIESKEKRHIVPLRKVFDEICEDTQSLISGRYAHNPGHSEALQVKSEKHLEYLRKLMKDTREGKIIVVK